MDTAIEAIIRQGLDMSPDCFGILNQEGVVVYCNETFAGAYGLSKEQAMGKTNRELLRLAWENKKGINIEAEDFDLWYRNIEKLQQEKKLNSFETDFTDGRWFKMTRSNMENGYILLFGVEITDLKETQVSLEKAYQRIESMAYTDQLTGVRNRRSFMYLFNREVKRAQRYQHPLTLLVMDLDHFKSINDNYGHEGGDFVLRRFAKLCLDQMRGSDWLFRIGGEEFAVLLPMTDVPGARHTAERIRKQIDSYNFFFKDLNQHIEVSVSIGISCLTGTQQTVKDILVSADKALYEAKRAGRNQVVVCS